MVLYPSWVNVVKPRVKTTSGPNHSNLYLKYMGDPQPRIPHKLLNFGEHKSKFVCSVYGSITLELIRNGMLKTA